MSISKEDEMTGEVRSKDDRLLGGWFFEAGGEEPEVLPSLVPDMFSLVINVPEKVTLSDMGKVLEKFLEERHHIKTSGEVEYNGFSVQWENSFSGNFSEDYDWMD